MKVRNKSTGKIISSHCQIAATFSSRLRGLMFSKKLHDLLLVSPREGVSSSSIHMCFMNFPIDVIWIDSNLAVVDAQPQLPPLNLLRPSTWKIYRPQKPAKYVLELKAGQIKTTGSKIGDEMEIIKK